MLKKILIGTGIFVLVALLGAAGFVYAQASAFDASIAKLYSVKSPAITASTDAQVIARGQHLAASLGSCFGCHGDDLGGKPGENMGPLGVVTASNLTR